MKRSSKFDAEALQQFALAHCEKGVLMIAVLLFMLLAYFAIARIASPKFTTTPQELEDAATQAEQHINQTPRDVLRDNLTFPDYRAVAEKGWQPDAKYYVQTRFWKAPLFPERRKRTEPKIFSVAQLMINTDAGPFSTRAVGENQAGVRGQRWVVITGLIPLAEEISAYREAFKDNTRSSDTVDYRGFRVERTELSDRGEPGKVESVDIDESQIKALVSPWPAPAQEIASTKVLDAVLTSPLPPLANRSWGAEVLHPRIPAAATEQPENAPVEKPVEKPAAKTSAFAHATEIKPAEPTTTTSDAAKETPYRLFRYFDLSVKPGKRYQYRIQLVLTNPNHGIEESVLAKPELAKEEFLYSEWSEPTPATVVPRDDRLYCMDVKPGHLGVEAQAILSVVKWLEDSGVFAWNSGDLPLADRGQLTFYHVAARTQSSEEHPAASPADLLLGDGTGKPAKKSKIKPPPDESTRLVDFASDFVLVDIRGGGRFEPAEFLLLDRDGSLVVRNDSRDAADFKALKSGGAALAKPGTESTIVPSLPSNGIDMGGGGLDKMEGGVSKPGRKSPRPK